MYAGLSKSSWDKLDSAISCFSKFEKFVGYSFAWPLSYDDILSFCTWSQSHSSLKASTIKAYISALATVHKLRNMEENFSSNYLVKIALKGIENLELYKGVKKYKRSAMSLPLLKIIGSRIASSNWTRKNKQVFWVACTVAFFGSCRLGELLGEHEHKFDPFLTLLWQDLCVRPDSVTIHIKSPKSRVPTGEFIDLFPFSDSTCCPVKSIQFLSSLNTKSNNGKNPVFMFDSGKLLTKQCFNTTIKQLLARDIGNNGFIITGHSFRQAIPTVLAKYPDLVKYNHIMGWGRWCSSAYLSYTKLQLCQKICTFSKIATELNKSL